MTYYEYFEFFFKVLSIFRDISRLDRMTAAKSEEQENSLMAEISSSSKASDNTQSFEHILVSLHNTIMGNHLNLIAVNSPQNLFPLYTYPVLRSQALLKATAGFLCPLLFASLSLDNFYEVLCNIYLEHSVIFISDNLNVLTSSM